MTNETELYVGGAWVRAHGEGRIEVINPATERVIGSVPRGDAIDVDTAVAAARAAFDAWAGTDVAVRADYLQAISDGLKRREREIGELVSTEEGMPVELSVPLQAGLPIGTFADAAASVRELELETVIGNSLVVREPIGVVASITPWNFPLHQIAAKVAPALAVGCTVVLKPSEVAPLNAFVLARVCEEVGLPAGVLNLVTGFGPEVGEALAVHPGVDMVSFTGSTAAGRRVAELAAATVKRVAVELGGKSANVLLDDADLEVAVPAGVENAFLNAGQTCSALTRMIVPRNRLAEAERLAADAAEAFTVGDPFDPSTRLGPLVSEVQRDRVLAYVRQGVAEGAKVVAGGEPDGSEPATGYFVRPTVFSEVTNDLTIAREEIFGPVLVLIPYDTVDEAVAIANDSPYGLSGGVWSGDRERAVAVARRLRTGQVEVNGGAWNPRAPFGGYKQSGNGRELGPLAFEEFLETKAMHL